MLDKLKKDILNALEIKMNMSIEQKNYTDNVLSIGEKEKKS